VFCISFNELADPVFSGLMRANGYRYIFPFILDVSRIVLYNNNEEIIIGGTDG
jgi:hypothetical protein